MKNNLLCLKNLHHNYQYCSESRWGSSGPAAVINILPSSQDKSDTTVAVSLQGYADTSAHHKKVERERRKCAEIARVSENIVLSNSWDIVFYSSPQAKLKKSNMYVLGSKLVVTL